MLYRRICLLQSAFFDYYAGNRHQIAAGARVKAVKITPKLLLTRVEVAKVAQLIGLSCKCGTNYTLCCGLARVRVESDKIVPKISLSPKFGACAGGSSENGLGNIFPAHYKECSLVFTSVSKFEMATHPYTSLYAFWIPPPPLEHMCFLNAPLQSTCS